MIVNFVTQYVRDKDFFPQNSLSFLPYLSLNAFSMQIVCYVWLYD